MAWTERTPACSVDKDWRVAATSWDVLAIACAVYGGRPYTSIDGGANWTEEQLAGDALKHWRLHACNASGSLVFAGVNNGRLYATGADTSPLKLLPDSYAGIKAQIVRIISSVDQIGPET